MKEVKGENYQATLDDENRLFLSGRLRLSGQEEYEPIIHLLELLHAKVGNIILDIQQLDFLNSSGIAMFSRFMINCRKRHTGTVTIIGNNQIVWQKKSLTNLQRLLPTLILEFK
jgi:anti-anti-sigma factor